MFMICGVLTFFLVVFQLDCNYTKILINESLQLRFILIYHFINIGSLSNLLDYRWLSKLCKLTRDMTLETRDTLFAII